MQVEGVSKGKGEVKGENVAPVFVLMHNHNIQRDDFVCSSFKPAKTDQTN